jgi:hypothetical protein
MSGCPGGRQWSRRKRRRRRRRRERRRSRRRRWWQVLLSSNIAGGVGVEVEGEGVGEEKMVASIIFTR